MKITAKQYAQGLFESLLDNKGKEEKAIANFAKILFANNQVSKLEEIIEHFNIFWNEYNGVIDGEIISARMLDEDLLKKLEKFISYRTGGKKIIIKEKIDQNIIGGVILRYGDRSLDLSLRTKLNNLKEELNS
jgi:F-type H+-transporting ATPase subunit delta